MAIYDGARILKADIETMMGLAEVPFYQLKQHFKFINPNYVKKPVTIVCAAWQWGDGPISSTSILRGGEEQVVRTLCDLINHADIIVAHNGDRFDWPMIRTRALYYGLPPFREPRTVDTLKALSKFKFESRALRYVNKYLGIAEKEESPDWSLIAEGDEQEIKNCERYCRQDIRALTEFYKKIAPWMPNHPNVGIYVEGLKHLVCSKCGSDDLKKNGNKFTQSSMYQTYQCNHCGGFTSDKKNMRAR